MPDPEILPPPEPTPIPRSDPPEGRRRPVCEFCGCKLTSSGEVLEVSDKAKSFRRHGETIETHVATIAKLEVENRELKSKLSELTTDRSGGFELLI